MVLGTDCRRKIVDEPPPTHREHEAGGWVEYGRANPLELHAVKCVRKNGGAS